MKNRIFWLGMHKILVETEFKLLASLGYDVFRPPYLSSIQDQSLSSDDYFGNSTLEPSVKQKLQSYNFFYNHIDDKTAEVLAENFDVVIVTINPDWLKSILQVFRGKVIYRCYGQPGTVSESLAHNGCKDLIKDRDNFYFIPHAQECLDDEQPWLKKTATVVPYWLTPDVLQMMDVWSNSGETRRSIALSCPNISNPYYNDHFRYLKTYFEERCYRYYGVQLDVNCDPNVVGTLVRHEQLNRLAQESGYLYTYRERNVCYLPPIEMMIIGGPVLYLPGSLLARYFDSDAPGLVRDETEAIRKSRYLMAGDKVFAKELIKSQLPVRYRYTESYGRDLFKSTFDAIINDGADRSGAAPSIRWPESKASPQKSVVIFVDLGGFVHKDGEYASIHGIPRVMRQVVRVLNSFGVPVALAYHDSPAEFIRGFFSAQCTSPELITTLPVKGLDAERLRALLDESEFAYAIVPHYHLFPEANSLDIEILAYIPDYMPHFFYGRDYFSESEEHLLTGTSLAKKAKFILTNSAFSKEYLPISKLKCPKDKLIDFPLPFLGSKNDAYAKHAFPKWNGFDPDARPFIFYPTQPHPHKRLDILLMAWIIANEGRAQNIDLVLTAGEISPKLTALVDKHGLQAHLYLLPGLSDSAIEYLYKTASCLAFSSELEGNFPTQILEAINLDCPVVCTDMPLIISELGDLAQYLQITSFGDVESFAESLVRAVDSRSKVLHKQGMIKPHVLEHFSFDRFRGNVIDLHRQMLA